jgi:glutathione S-transferase
MTLKDRLLRMPCRFILNYKRLRYRTLWIELPDVETTLRSIGAPPSGTRNNGQPIYSLPVLIDPTRNPARPEIISTATFIAEYLETMYPSRPIFPTGSRALQTLFVHYIQEVFSKPLLPILVPLSHQQLNQRSQTHFRQHPSLSSGYTSAHDYGMSSNQPLPPGPRRDQAWLIAKEQFDFLDMVLRKNAGNGDGAVAMGHDLSYADFALCAVMVWIRQIAPSDGWDRVRLWNQGRWERLWERCKPYMDDH